MKVTPNLVVSAVEPSLEFFRDRLGFEVAATVPHPPHGVRLGFAMLQSGAAEVMLQSRASIADDAPGLERVAGTTFLYVEVDDFERAAASVAGLEVVIARRDTFYGMRELAVREPGGHVVCLAWKIAPPA